MKPCKKCGVTKPLSEFYKNKLTKDGHINKCKPCRLQEEKDRPKRDPQYMKEYYEANKQKWKDGWEKHKEKNLEKARQWKKDNYEWVRDNNRKRRELKTISDYKFSKDYAKQVYSKFDNQCFNCGSKENLAIDHHVPLSKGKQLTLSNAVILCRSCNSSKKDKMPKDFYSKEQLQELRGLGVK
jgi:hypothetical protein